MISISLQQFVILLTFISINASKLELNIKSKSQPKALSPGNYRILGAEGDASLTGSFETVGELQKVSMKLWTSSPEQIWSLTQLENGFYELQNSVINGSVLSLNPDKSRREWNLINVSKGDILQIKDTRTRMCLKRLGVTVYHEGDYCDSYAQSQIWIFTPV